MLGAVADWMNRDFPTLQPSVSLAAARAFLVEHAAPDALVVDSCGRLAGVITDYEILKAELLGEADDTAIDRWLTRNVWTLEPTEDLLAAAAKFREARSSLAAVIEDGRLLGGLRRQDILRAVDTLRQQAPRRDSAALRLDGPALIGNERIERCTDFALARG